MFRGRFLVAGEGFFFAVEICGFFRVQLSVLQLC